MFRSTILVVSLLILGWGLAPAFAATPATASRPRKHGPCT